MSMAVTFEAVVSAIDPSVEAAVARYLIRNPQLF
jgi:hypothetical protein